MLVHPQFDPIAFAIGPVSVRWYGLMYLLGFALFLILGRLRAGDAWRGMSKQDVDDLLFWGVIGVIVGGRLGHVVFYGPLTHYLAHPLEIFMVWKGGMASHGGIVGVIVAMWLWSRARGKSFLKVADFVVPLRRRGTICRATPRSSISLRWRASRCSCCSGGSRASSAHRVWSVPCSWSATACSG